MSWDGGVISENNNRPAGIDQMAMRLNQVCRSESGRRSNNIINIITALSAVAKGVYT